MGWVEKDPHEFCWNTIDLEPGSIFLLDLESPARAQVKGRSSICIPLSRKFDMVLRPRTL